MNRPYAIRPYDYMGHATSEWRRQSLISVARTSPPAPPETEEERAARITFENAVMADLPARLRKVREHCGLAPDAVVHAWFPLPGDPISRKANDPA